jgi:hypothetical protein
MTTPPVWQKAFVGFLNGQGKWLGKRGRNGSATVRENYAEAGATWKSGGSSTASSKLKMNGIHSLRKTSGSRHVLKGRGFPLRRKSSKVNLGFSCRGTLPT